MKMMLMRMMVVMMMLMMMIIGEDDVDEDDVHGEDDVGGGDNLAVVMTAYPLIDGDRIKVAILNYDFCTLSRYSCCKPDVLSLP